MKYGPLFDFITLTITDRVLWSTYDIFSTLPFIILIYYEIMSSFLT